MEIDIGEIIVDEELDIEDIELDVVKEFPELEDLEVIPSGEEQNFKSNKYGYDNVKVKAVESEELNIIPGTENQVKEGLYNKVTVTGDNDLVPENIKEGINLFGVEGIAKTVNLEITDGRYLFYNGARTDYFDELMSLCKKITNADNMFSYCSNLEEIDLTSVDISEVKDMGRMFYSMTPLRVLNLNNCDAGKVTNVYNFISYCSNLTDLKFMKNLGKGFTATTSNYGNYSLNFSSSRYLTHESLTNIINNLHDLNLTYDVANGGTLYTQNLNLGATNLAKLTEEEIAIAISKGWNVS